MEGPGRRVGYDDFTAIDWIYEYTKERQRKRLLYSSGQGLLGHARRLLEASNVWFVLISTGIAVGIIAAAIDIATDWLGDLKTGYCKSGRGGGKFYLNRSFCCWGLDGESRLSFTVWANSMLTKHADIDYSKCLDWTPWGNALGASSTGGRYTIEYIFYIVFSVRGSILLQRLSGLLILCRFSLLCVPVFWFGNMPFTPDTVVFLRSKRSLEGQSSAISWGHGRLPSNRSDWYVFINSTSPPWHRLLSNCCTCSINIRLVFWAFSHFVEYNYTRLLLLITLPVSLGRIRSLARQRRPTRACGMLLCQHHDETFY